MSVMTVINIKNNLQRNRNSTTGVSIVFQSNKNIDSGYIYILENDVKKYFKIIETSCFESSEYLINKALETGYSKDKISNNRSVDIRNYLRQEIFILDSEEEIKELQKRSSYC